MEVLRKLVLGRGHPSLSRKGPVEVSLLVLLLLGHDARWGSRLRPRGGRVVGTGSVAAEARGVILAHGVITDGGSSNGAAAFVWALQCVTGRMGGPTVQERNGLRQAHPCGCTPATLAQWHPRQSSARQTRLVLVVSEVCAGRYGAGRTREGSTRGEERLVGWSAAGPAVVVSPA